MTGPQVPFDSYFAGLLDVLVGALGGVLPYAAALTAFAIGVGMVKRWLGHRSATSLAGARVEAETVGAGCTSGRRYHVDGGNGYCARCGDEL